MIGHLLTGRYLILKKLGAGGFSETYLARDKYLPHHPLCVVKCLKLSPNSAISQETAMQLFETEARILDQLGQHHPQIPTLFAYCHEQDQVYQVQEYIEGENLGDWVAQGQRLTPEAAIELLLQVLPVLDYIHCHRVIHRDIKPNNLIRRRQDGRIVLIDFGAACPLLENEAETKPDSDDTSLAIGTPGYMPDEQQLGMSQPNSDLYALGVVVIQLITGVLPQQFQQDLISGELDWQVHLPNRSIDPNLTAILDHLVRSHSRDRYQQAVDALAAIQALPLTKRPSRRWFVSRSRRSIQALKSTAIAVLLIGLVGGGYVYSHHQQTGTSLAWLNFLLRQPDVRLTMLQDLSVPFAIDRMLITPNNHVLVTAGSDYILRLWSIPDGSMQKSLLGHTNTVTALNMNQAGSLLVSGSKDRTVRLWDVASGELLQTFAGHPATVTAVAISPDERTIVSAAEDGTVRLWDLQTKALLKTLTISNTAITALSYGTTPDSLVSASGNRLQVWDLQTEQLRRTFAGHTAPIARLQVVDNRTLVSFGSDRTLVWNLQSEELMQVGSEDSASPVTASLDQRHIVTVNDNGNVRVWLRQAERLVKGSSGKLGQNLNIALSPDHHYLVSLTPTRRLQVWQITTTKE